MHKRKGLVIFLIILIIVLLFMVVTSVIYLRTDFLKTNKQLFYKYLLEDNQMLEMLESVNYEKNTKSYTSNGNINFVYEVNDKLGVSEIDSIAKNIKEKLESYEEIKNVTGTMKGNVDKNNKNEYYEIQLEKNSEQIMNLELVKNEDKYAWKSKQIMNAYVGIENNNLKNFLKKIGIENDELIPNKIDFDKAYKAITEMNPDEKEHVFETYKDVLIQSIDNDNYDKQSNQKININNSEYNTDLYSLNLTKAESIENFVKILKTLKQDSITLNMICNKIKVINPDSDINISKLVNKIDLYIEEANRWEKSDSEYIRIDVYVDKKIVRKVDFSIENRKQICFEYEDKEGKQILQISQNNIYEEPTAIVYDLRESLQHTKKIKIVKEADYTTYGFVMYNIKDMYKAILDRTSNQEDVNQFNQYNIEDLKNIYEKYKNNDDQLSEISFNIKLPNNKDDKTIASMYLLVADSKIGIDILEEKNYTDNIENTITLNKNNSIMLNNYSKETIEKILNTIKTVGAKTLKNKIGL